MSRDLSSRGWSSSTAGYAPKAKTTKLNLTTKGYPSSMDGFTPTNSSVDTTNNGLNGSKTKKTYDALMAAYRGNGLYDQKNLLAQQAYEKNMAALNEAYGAYMAALADNLNSTKGTLRDSYDRSKKSIQQDAANSLKQAYINKMMSEKNIDQRMAAQGLSGGATETTRASMANNYGNARNEINTTTNNNLSQLEGQYNENLANAMSAYNQAVAQAQLQKAQQMMQLEDALMNNKIAALDDFYDLMGDTTGNYENSLAMVLNNKDMEFDPIEASNAVKAMELYQNNPSDDRTYANLMAALQAIMNQQGNGNMAVANPMQNNYMAAILNQLYGGH